MLKRIIFAIWVAIATIGMQACFSSSTEQSASTPACSQGETNCKSATTKSSWGFFF